MTAEVGLGREVIPVVGVTINGAIMKENKQYNVYIHVHVHGMVSGFYSPHGGHLYDNFRITFPWVQFIHTLIYMYYTYTWCILCLCHIHSM